MYVNGVFEGGGIKGLAYIGALRFLEERGIRFNKIAGTSVGAIFGSLVICGYDSHELEDITNQINIDTIISSNTRSFNKILNSIKQKGLYSISKFESFIDDLYVRKGKRVFGDLKVGDDYLLKVIVTDLKNKRMLILPNDLVIYNINPDSFLISKAVAMSSSIPLVFTPYKFGNNYFYDGGVSNNFPINIFDNENDTLTLGLMLGRNQEGFIKKIQQKAFDIKSNYNPKKHKIVEIDSYKIKATDFKIGLENRYLLFKSGYRCMRNFFYSDMLRGLTE